MGSKVSEFRKKKLGQFFNFIDLDKDGYITMDDHMQNVSNLQKELNLGEKGLLTCRRITLSWWAMFQEEADKNGGRVDIDYCVKRSVEYMESEDISKQMEDHYKAMFRFIDQNGDQAVSFDEFLAYYRAHDYGDADSIREIFSRLDTNKDGSLSEDEFISANLTFGFSDDPENGYEFLYETC